MAARAAPKGSNATRSPRTSPTSCCDRDAPALRDAAGPAIARPGSGERGRTATIVAAGTGLAGARSTAGAAVTATLEAVGVRPQPALLDHRHMSDDGRAAPGFCEAR